jgi:hypothetical protein
LLANSQAPLSPEMERTVADVWVNYQLVALAAARGDSLTSQSEIEEAMWPTIAQARASRWHEQVVSGFSGIDTTVSEARYARGDLLAAQHILLRAEGDAAVRDSVRRRAEELRRQVTAGNFAEMARRHSADPGSAAAGGVLGVFPRGAMVPAFEQGVAALQPGEISPVVETQFGYHIIRRLPLNEIRDQFAGAVRVVEMQRAESVWVAGLEQGYGVKYRPNAAQLVRRAVEDPEGNERSRSVIATSRSGDLTAGRLARWVAALPQRDQLRMGMSTADDSMVLDFARRVMTQEMVLHQADSAAIQLDSTDMQQVREIYTMGLLQSWSVLGVLPRLLADSAESVADRERLAAQRVERYVDALLGGQAQFLDIPGPIQSAVRGKYSWRLTNAGINRAVELAQQRRVEADSLARANRPSSAVPIMPQVPEGQGQEQDD